jgi:hypothetical protein
MLLLAKNPDVEIRTSSAVQLSKLAPSICVYKPFVRSKLLLWIVPTFD